MRTLSRKHASVHNGKPQSAQVTIAEIKPGEESQRPAKPELFLNDFRVNNLSPADARLVDGVVQAVRETEAKLGWSGPPLSVLRIESSYVGRDPEAAKVAAVAAATALIQEG